MKTRERDARAPFWQKMCLSDRVSAAVVAIAAGAGIALAFWFTPDARGLGTHEQLGLRPCLTALLFDIPCPFCGMTTAASLMAHGQPGAAFKTQPAGALAFIVAAVGAALCVAFAVTGRWPAVLTTARWGKPLVIVSAVIILLAWIYKIYMYRM